jgi:hypothetical protein
MATLIAVNNKTRIFSVLFELKAIEEINNKIKF